MASRSVGCLVLVSFAAIVSIRLVQAQDAGTKAAQTSVETWLALVDSQKFAASWDAAGSVFRNAITQANWQAAVQAARTPLGALKSRTLASATPTKSLPGAPQGEYVVIQFDASFEQRAAAVETVTAMLEKDGSWRVVGYFIK